MTDHRSSSYSTFGLVIGSLTALAYGWACASAVSNPWRGEWTLIALGMLISLPAFAEGLMTKIMIAGCFTFLGVLFPPLLPIIAIVGLLIMLGSLAEKALLLLTGVTLYYAIFLIPGFLNKIPYVVPVENHIQFARGIAFVLGLTVMSGIGLFAAQRGYSARVIAFCTIGLPAFLLLLLLPGPDGASDGDMGTSHHQ